MKKFTAKRVAVLGVLLAAASIVFIVESLVPPLLPFAPYVKIGLANCFVLFVIIYFGFAEGVIFLVVKNAISALWSFSSFVFVFNVAGSFAAFLVMALLYRVAFPKVSLVAVSIAGAVCSNIARTCLASLLMETPVAVRTIALCVRVQRACGHFSRCFDGAFYKTPARKIDKIQMTRYNRKA